jgi:hypothetical protein
VIPKSHIFLLEKGSEDNVLEEIHQKYNSAREKKMLVPHSVIWTSKGRKRREASLQYDNNMQKVVSNDCCSPIPGWPKRQYELRTDITVNGHDRKSYFPFIITCLFLWNWILSQELKITFHFRS